MTRSLYHSINQARRWESFIKLDDLAILEVEWWMNNVRSVAKYPMKKDLSAVPAVVKTASDGSGIGYFSYEIGNKTCLARRAFTPEETLQSSTFRELLAFHDTWTNVENLSRFQGLKISLHTDSQALVHIIAKGSRNRKLQPMIMKVTLSLREFGIVVEPVWMSRDDGIIKYADMSSRDFHSDDISVDSLTFQKAVDMFGPFSVDGFASASNAKCLKYFSKLDVPGSSVGLFQDYKDAFCDLMRVALVDHYGLNFKAETLRKREKLEGNAKLPFNAYNKSCDVGRWMLCLLFEFLENM